METSMTSWTMGAVSYIALSVGFLAGWCFRGALPEREHQKLPARFYCGDGEWWQSEEGRRALEVDMAVGDPWHEA